MRFCLLKLIILLVTVLSLSLVLPVSASAGEINDATSYTLSSHDTNHNFSVLGNIAMNGEQPIPLNNRELSEVEGEGYFSAIRAVCSAIYITYGHDGAGVSWAIQNTVLGGFYQLSMWEFKNIMIRKVPGVSQQFIEATARLGRYVLSLPTD